jgi:hypothetical protein
MLAPNLRLRPGGRLFGSSSLIKKHSINLIIRKKLFGEGVHHEKKNIVFASSRRVFMVRTVHIRSHV